VEVLEDRCVLSATAPTVVDDWTDTDGTTPVAVDVLANDSAPAGAHLVPSSVTVVSGLQHGTASVDSTTGTITYTAAADFAGTDTFQYTVRDDQGATSVAATVSVRVNRPVAADDWTDTDGTTSVNVAVLANDTDPDGNQHIDPTRGTGAFVTLVSGASHGSVSANSDGSFTYTASPGFTGTDSFRYTVTDDNGGTSNVATAYVRVNVPTAADDFGQTTAALPVSIDVLANDTDPDGNGHLVRSSVQVVSGPQHGSVSVDSGTGRITYTPTTGFGGTDTFRYTVSDDNGATSAPATVTIVDIVPNAVNDDVTDTDGTTPVAVNVLANDSAQAGAHLVPSSVTVVTGPQHGTTSVDSATGTITYRASDPFVGTDTFQYTVRDDRGSTSAPTTVSVRVNRPVAADDWTDTDGTTPVNVAVLANDQDPDGPSHIDPTRSSAMVRLAGGASHGSVTANSDGSFTYTAAAGFTGTDSFRYTVTDDNGGTSNVATAFVRVNVPTAADDFGQTQGTQSVTIDVLANDTDPDGNGHLVPSSVKVVSGPQHGSLRVDSGTGRITYTPTGFGGTDTFQYTVRDDNGATSSPATVTIINTLPDGTIPVAQPTPPLAVQGVASVSVAAGPRGAVMVVVAPTGILTQFDTTGAHTLGANVRSASVGFGPVGEVLVVGFQDGSLVQFDAFGAHALGSGVRSASVAFGPRGEVLDVVFQDGTLTRFSALGAQTLTGGVASASTAFGPRGVEVVDVVFRDGTLRQFTPFGTQTVAGGALSASVTFVPAGEVLDVLFQDGSLVQFDVRGARLLGKVF
jgi:hypothetical protein